MTASPNWPRSQAAEIETARELRKPGSPRSRCLPPTLLKLRDLNPPTPVVPEPGNAWLLREDAASGLQSPHGDPAPAYGTAANQAPPHQSPAHSVHAAHAPSLASVLPTDDAFDPTVVAARETYLSGPHSIATDLDSPGQHRRTDLAKAASGNEAAKPGPAGCDELRRDQPPLKRRALVTRLSSQAFVVCVIVAIAVAGIIVGNGGNQPSDSVAKESPKADDSQFVVDEGVLSPAFEPAEETPHNNGGSAPQPSASDVAQPAPTPPQPVSDQSSGAPATLSLAAQNASHTVTPWATIVPTEAPLTSPPHATGQPAAGLGAHTQSRTPVGIDDWTRYLPRMNPSDPVSLGGDMATGGADATTAAATTQTPDDPNAAYQQYLESQYPIDSDASSSTGFTADPTDPYGTNYLGTQALAPQTTSPTQRR